MMSTLPKSVVIQGRRYPTWALSRRARQLLENLQQVDAHIAELKQRQAYYLDARHCCSEVLRQALSRADSATPCYYWQMAPSNVLASGRVVSLSALDAENRYRAGDALLVYIKGVGVCGWGYVQWDDSFNGEVLVWQRKVTDLALSLPAKALKKYALRHPTRAYQRIPDHAAAAALIDDIAGP